MEINLQNFFKYYNSNNPQHIAAVAQLEVEIRKLNSNLLLNSSDWIKTYRSNPLVPEIKKTVPFYPQTDNYTQPDRTCNSSSCAMCLKYYRPNSLSNSPTADDEYLKKVISLGDSTDHEVQTKVLSSYGLQSKFRYDLSFVDLDRELAANHPMVIGICHRGPDDNPTGGHMIVIHTKLPNGDYVCHDPYGDMKDGYTTNVQNGKNVIYTYKILQTRWTVKNTAGWGRTFTL